MECIPPSQMCIINSGEKKNNEFVCSREKMYRRTKRPNTKTPFVIGQNRFRVIAATDRVNNTHVLSSKARKVYERACGFSPSWTWST